MAMIFSLHQRVFNSAHMVAPLACDPLKPWSSLQVTARRLQESVPKQAVTPEAAEQKTFLSFLVTFKVARSPRFQWKIPRNPAKEKQRRMKNGQSREKNTLMEVKLTGVQRSKSTTVLLQL